MNAGRRLNGWLAEKRRNARRGLADWLKRQVLRLIMRLIDPGRRP